ncbi:hypothetical protein GCM10010359_11600 [Streptomyces morookaense]|nr:hypothetical protein GCM10010359_11600 [Streptomyces morookaense]
MAAAAVMKMTWPRWSGWALRLSDPFAAVVVLVNVYSWGTPATLPGVGGGLSGGRSNDHHVKA